ncbi:DNA helicase [Cronobacter phage vB_Cdu_VP8]|nr:DNA helicase [Cronobacter phage vB_Cdu_VP8]
MKEFKELVYEASIDSFMQKIYSCQTKDGLLELEKYYKSRVKDTELKDTDDISIRDAIAGKMSEFDASEPDEDEEEF